MQNLAAYFIAGLFLTLIFNLLGKIKKETRLADSSFVFLLWPIALLFRNKLFKLENSKPKTKLDELSAIIERYPELKIQKELYQERQELSLAGADKDEIPTGNPCQTIQTAFSRKEQRNQLESHNEEIAPVFEEKLLRKKVRILFFDPDLSTFDFYYMAFTHRGFVCLHEFEETKAFDILKKNCIDIVVIWSHSTVEKCVKLVKNIRVTFDTNILVLLDHNHKNENGRFLDAGADSVVIWSPKTKAGELFNDVNDLMETRYSRKEIERRFKKRHQMHRKEPESRKSLKYAELEELESNPRLGVD